MSFGKFHKDVALSGRYNATCPANQATTMNWTTDKLYYMDGAEYFSDCATIGNRLTFQIVHPQAGVLKTFVDEMYVGKEKSYEFYASALPAGIIIRVIYENNSNVAVEFSGNLYLHVDEI